jgi:hypothetical protein
MISFFDHILVYFNFYSELQKNCSLDQNSAQFFKNKSFEYLRKSLFFIFTQIIKYLPLMMRKFLLFSIKVMD